MKTADFEAALSVQCTVCTAYWPGDCCQYVTVKTEAGHVTTPTCIMGHNVQGRVVRCVLEIFPEVANCLCISSIHIVHILHTMHYILEN